MWTVSGLLAITSPVALGQSSTQVRAPGARNVLDCVRAIEDQNGGACLEASSVATQGLLFPYPGEGNVFAERSVVSGGVNNDATGFRATIGGGEANSATGTVSAVLGGGVNSASGGYAMVGGGLSNIASGDFGTLSGGVGSDVGGRAATVGGGYFNQASEAYATASGGIGNAALGYTSTVPGGRESVALGAFSFAAGRRARANHQGAFVWGDSVDVNKTSSTDNEFNIFAEGGMRVFAQGQGVPSLVVNPVGEVGVGVVPTNNTPFTINDSVQGDTLALLSDQGGSGYHLDFDANALCFVETRGCEPFGPRRRRQRRNRNGYADVHARSERNRGQAGRRSVVRVF